jgi:hypothetical protein
LAVSPEGVVYAVGKTGLSVFDARRPERTREIGQFQSMELPDGNWCFIQQDRGQLLLRKDRLYLRSGERHLLCIDVSNPVKPKPLAQIGFPQGISGGVYRFSGTRVLVNDGKGVSPLNLAVPARARPLSPEHRDYIGIEGLEGTLHDVAISTDLRYAYASAKGPTLYTLDLKESKVVKTVSFAKALPGMEFFSLALSPDERVLAAAMGGGVVALNVVDPLNPRFAGRFPGTGRGRLRFYGDLIMAGGHGYTLTINRVTGTENVGTVGETTTQRGESTKHWSKRPGKIVHPKKPVAGPQSYPIRWPAVRRAGRGHYTAYTVAYRGLYDVVWAKDTVESLGGTARHTLTGLEPNMYYLARVRTVLEDGEVSPWSEIHQFLTPSPAPTWAKEWLTDVTSTTATLTWAVPDGAEKAFVAFDIYYRPGRGQWTTVEAREAGVFTRTLIGLKPQTAYQVRVQGNYGALNGSPYTTVNILVTKPK